MRLSTDRRQGSHSAARPALSPAPPLPRAEGAPATHDGLEEPHRGAQVNNTVRVDFLLSQACCLRSTTEATSPSATAHSSGVRPSPVLVRGWGVEGGGESCNTGRCVTDGAAPPPRRECPAGSRPGRQPSPAFAISVDNGVAPAATSGRDGVSAAALCPLPPHHTAVTAPASTPAGPDGGRRGAACLRHLGARGVVGGRSRASFQRFQPRRSPLAAFPGTRLPATDPPTARPSALLPARLCAAALHLITAAPAPRSQRTPLFNAGGGRGGGRRRWWGWSHRKPPPAAPAGSRLGERRHPSAASTGSTRCGPCS